MTEFCKHINGLRWIPAIIVLMVSIAAGCSSDDCEGNKNALPLAGFYSSSDPQKAIAVDSLEIIGVGAPGNQQIIDDYSPLSQVYLPFRIDSDTTVIALKYMQKNLAMYDISDTITFRYERIPFFVSSACGAMYYFKIIDIRHTGMALDSVTCPLGTITNAAIENLKFYFKTSSDE